MGTDGLLFTTDVCANFKVMWHKKTMLNIRNPTQSNLDIVPRLRIHGQLPAAIVNGGGGSFWKRLDFQIWRAYDLDLGSGHTAYRRASLVNLYLHAKFHGNRTNFVDGWTNVCMYIHTHVCTDRRTFETGFIG